MGILIIFGVLVLFCLWMTGVRSHAGRYVGVRGTIIAFGGLLLLLILFMLLMVLLSILLR